MILTKGLIKADIIAANRAFFLYLIAILVHRSTAVGTVYLLVILAETVTAYGTSFVFVHYISFQ